MTRDSPKIFKPDLNSPREPIIILISKKWKKKTQNIHR